MPNRLMMWGSIHGFLAVALGAFGAHILEERITASLMETYQTGIQYHMLHALALFAAAWACTRFGDQPSIRWAGRLFHIGIILFSGSLYVLALTGIRGLGAITPLGGFAFLAGWLLLAWASRKFVE